MCNKFSTSYEENVNTLLEGFCCCRILRTSPTLEGIAIRKFMSLSSSSSFSSNCHGFISIKFSD
mgnify:CR=1 FL=1